MEPRLATSSPYESRARRSRAWSRALFWVWLSMLGVTLAVLVITLANPGELLHFGRQDLYILAGGALLAELVLTLPILIASAVLDSRAKRLQREVRGVRA